MVDLTVKPLLEESSTSADAHPEPRARITPASNRLARIGPRLLRFTHYGRVNHAGNGSPQNRRQPKEPKLFHGPATDQQGRTGAARGIHGRVRNGNANQVNQGQPRSEE